MKRLFLLLLLPYHCFAGVCDIITSPDSPSKMIYDCKDGEVLDVYVGGTNKSSTVQLNFIKANFCNHKYTISIYPNPDSLSLSCIFKNNRE